MFEMAQRRARLAVLKDDVNDFEKPRSARDTSRQGSGGPANIREHFLGLSAMQRIVRLSIGLAISSLAIAAAAQQPIIYPARGQSPERQRTDTAECQAWAQQTTGVDPVALAQQMASSPPPPSQQGHLFRGAGGGALFGTLIGGAAGGHWGEGAGIGALVGTMGSGMRMRREQQQAAMQQGSMQQQASSQLSTYNRAVGACMTGRGYTVE
ncbi:glycine zipper family protein [Paraburkholderia hospita]|jgi:hypothetical protein|uniref:glycine zipper family protein n=1 Tax=Paraburkholderia hospita TaxID=169430 RepID=UPI003ECDCCCF